MNLEQIRARLEALKAEYEEVARLRPITTKTIDHGEKLRLQIVSLERKLREIQQKQYLIPIDGWQIRWTGCETDVHLHALQRKAIICCKRHMTRGANPCVIVLEFGSCIASRITFIDYDNLEQHPLFDSGLEGLGAYYVRNSTWKQEVEENVPGSNCIHHLFCFNSCLAEVLAVSVKANVIETSVSEVINHFLSGRS